MHVILLEPRFNACAWTQMQEYLLRRRGRFRRVSSVLVFQGTCRSVFHCVLVFDPLRRPNLTDLPKQTESSTAGRRYIPGCARNRRWCHIRHVSKDTRRHQRNILFMTDQVRFRDARAVYEWIVIELNERNNKNTSHHNKITWNQNIGGKSVYVHHAINPIASITIATQLAPDCAPRSALLGESVGATNLIANHIA